MSVNLKRKTMITRMKDAFLAVKKPLAKAARATVLVAGLALAGAGCNPHCESNNCSELSKPDATNCRQSEKDSPEVDAGTKAKGTVSGPVGAGGLMFGNTTLVDVNGAPVVKVVLGSKSKPKDAIAAALIVQTITANTYKRIRLTAQLTGTATCSAEPKDSKCSVDMSGVSSVIMPYNSQSVVVTEPYTHPYGNLLVLDLDAVGLMSLVSVGGPQENSVTSSLLMGTSVDWVANPIVVKEIVAGSKIVVAGATPEQTLQAAQMFISHLVKD
jgi:hypothetical protein